MAKRTRVMYILMPFKPELRPVKHTLEEVAAMTGYLPKRSDEAPGGGDLIKAIIEGILRADLIIADLTYSNPNVLYELVSGSGLPFCYLVPEDDIATSWQENLAFIFLERFTT